MPNNADKHNKMMKKDRGRKGGERGAGRRGKAGHAMSKRKRERGNDKNASYLPRCQGQMANQLHHIPLKANQLHQIPLEANQLHHIPPLRLQPPDCPASFAERQTQQPDVWLDWRCKSGSNVESS